ncbi:NAD(P)-dependent dehydrogenase, short-chain alcohol dehydrogenase family [Amycolatopsis xylanica]|uniref:NAD(P)-dependent dehydrogenase, short-chain alcohol dehydrogenase family n=1 Tax=Amycolatopsis xylanica TaxID=589385 RepID=A0A1H3LPD3_9PSEU|nr:SDR family NAD(P)-dependent oxidoreductase [Amycolatopsis xylanica]SDY65838.1 NAD(P)-dependent dehydrogenase, short-chain alcohol dehydrogenase family [Amycolatopsis xylanica]
MQLEGKTAFVTGGSRGIGAAIAVRLAAEGADIALTYVAGADAAAGIVGRIEALGRKAFAFQADSADARSVRTAVDAAAAALGKLDVVVHNAGVFSAGPIEEITAEEIDRVLAIHVRAVLVGTQAALPHMPDGGRIISIGSNLADRVARPGLTLYSASKAALDGLTRGLARDLGSRGITAVLVQPGSTDTDMNPASSPHADDQRALSALGHYGAAEDIAATVAHLAGPGGRHISGTTITIDGGQNA